MRRTMTTVVVVAAALATWAPVSGEAAPGEPAGDMNPNSPESQCVARCCPWPPGDPADYVECLKRHHDPCQRDPKAKCLGPPSSSLAH